MTGDATGRGAVLARAEAFCRAYDLTAPILMAPMAGASPPALAIAVAQAGGMGAGGCLLMEPEQIAAWTAKVRAGSQRGLPAQLVDSRSASGA